MHQHPEVSTFFERSALSYVLALFEIAYHACNNVLQVVKVWINGTHILTFFWKSVLSVWSQGFYIFMFCVSIGVLLKGVVESSLPVQK